MRSRFFLPTLLAGVCRPLNADQSPDRPVDLKASQDSVLSGVSKAPKRLEHPARGPRLRWTPPSSRRTTAKIDAARLDANLRAASKSLDESIAERKLW